MKFAILDMLFQIGGITVVALALYAIVIKIRS